MLCRPLVSFNADLDLESVFADFSLTFAVCFATAADPAGNCGAVFCLGSWPGFGLPVRRGGVEVPVFCLANCLVGVSGRTVCAAVFFLEADVGAGDCVPSRRAVPGVCALVCTAPVLIVRGFFPASGGPSS